MNTENISPKDRLKTFLKTLPRPSKPIHWVGVTLAFLLILMPTVPPLIAVVIKSVADDQGFQMSYEDADISPIDGKAEYRNLQVEHNGKLLFKASHLIAHIDPGAAFDDKYIVKEGLVDQAYLDFSVLPKSAGGNQAATAPKWLIQQLLINQMQIVALPAPAPDKVTLNKLIVNDLDSDAEKLGKFVANIHYNKTQLNIISDIGLQPEPRFNNLDLNVRSLSLEDIPAEYLPKNLQLSGRINLQALLTWPKFTPQERQLHSDIKFLSIEQAGIAMDTLSLNIRDSTISGPAIVDLNNHYQPSQAEFDGKVDLNITLQDSAKSMPNIKQASLTSTVKAKHNLTEQQLELSNKGKLTLTGLHLQGEEKPDIQTDLQWQGQSTSTLLLDASNVQTALKGTLAVNKLNVKMPTGETIQGQLNWQDKLDTTVIVEGSRILTEFNGKLNSTLAYADPAGKTPAVALDELSYQGRGSANINEGEEPNARLTGDIKFARMSASKIASNPGLVAHVHNGSINAADVQSSPQRINIKDVILKKITLSGKQPADDLPVDNIIIKNISMAPSQLNISSIDIGKLTTHIKKTAEGDYALTPAELLPEPAEEKASAGKQNDAALKISIGSIKLGKDSHISVVDNSVKPSFKTSLVFEKADIENLNMPARDQKTSITANGKLGQRGTFNLDGEAQILKDGLNLAATSRLTGLSIEQYSQYAQSQIGYGMKKGYMDLNIDVGIEGKKLDGKSKLLITGLEVEPTQNKIQEKFDNTIGLSLTSALGLLTDKKGHIDLEIPISGDTDNPDFGMGDIIGKAIGKGIKGGLLLSLQPLGLAVLAVDAIASAGGIPLGQVEFEEGSSLLNSIAAERLTLLAEKMQEKPAMQLKICPIAIETEQPQKAKLPNKEQAADSSEAQSDSEKSEKKAEVKPDPVFTAKLVQQRLDTVLGFLAERGITRERTVYCEPQILATEKASPSVQLIIPDEKK